MHFVPTVTRALIDVCIIHDALKKGQQLAYAQRTTPWCKHGYFTGTSRVYSTVQYSNAKLIICIWCKNLWWLDGIIDPIWLTFRLGFCEITFWLILLPPSRLKRVGYVWPWYLWGIGFNQGQCDVWLVNGNWYMEVLISCATVWCRVGLTVIKVCPNPLIATHIGQHNGGWVFGKHNGPEIRAGRQ